MIFHGIRTCIAKKPYIFVIFRGGGGGGGSRPPTPHIIILQDHLTQFNLGARWMYSLGVNVGVSMPMFMVIVL